MNLINHTMMPHPIHLHGHFFEVVNGQKGQYPRKNVVNVLPGAKVTFDFTADAMGDWAFHCHMLMHMHAGMFRVVTVRHEEERRMKRTLLLSAAMLLPSAAYAAQDHSAHQGHDMPAEQTKAEAPPAATDPHAGHDMGNMERGSGRTRRSPCRT